MQTLLFNLLQRASTRKTQRLEQTAITWIRPQTTEIHE